MMVGNHYMFIMPIILLPSNVHRYNPDVKINSVDTNVIIVFPQDFPRLHVQCSCFKKKKKVFPSLPALTKCCATVQVACFKRQLLHTMLTLAGGGGGGVQMVCFLKYMYTLFMEVSQQFCHYLWSQVLV